MVDSNLDMVCGTEMPAENKAIGTEYTRTVNLYEYFCKYTP